MDDYDDRD